MNQKVIGDQLENDCHKDYTYEDKHVHLPETTHKFTKKCFVLKGKQVPVYVYITAKKFASVHEFLV